MQWIPPSSDANRLELLQTLQQQLNAPNLPFEVLSTSHLQALDRLVLSYRAVYFDLIAAREAHAHWQLQSKQAEQQLRFLLRDAFQLVRRQRRNPNFPASLFEAFGLTRDAKQTDASHYLIAPIELAYSMVTAQETALQQGFHVLTDPSPQALIAAAQSLRQHRARLVEARNREQQVLAQMRELRLEAQQMLIRIRTAIKLATIGMKPLDQQLVQQAMGFEYRHKSKPSTPATTNDQADAGSGPENRTESAQCINAASDPAMAQQQPLRAASTSSLSASPACQREARDSHMRPSTHSCATNNNVYSHVLVDDGGGLGTDDFWGLYEGEWWQHNDLLANGGEGPNLGFPATPNA